MALRPAVIFDLDGTLTVPFLDFDAIRAEIGILTGPILEAIAKMESDARKQAEIILSRHEWRAAREATLHDGAVEVVARCRTVGFATAILTRNAREPAQHVIDTFGLEVDALRTREDGAIKPSPEPVFALCSELSADPKRSWVVGDYLFDLQAGRAAGARTILMIGNRPPPAFAGEADHVVRALSEVPDLLSSPDRRTASAGRSQ